MSTHRRQLLLTAELLRAYSRRGNFHSDPDEASKIGFTGLVAQGMQVAGPAYGALLDFVGMVMDGETVNAAVTIEDDRADVEVMNRDRDHVAVVGRASRRGGHA